MTEWPKNPALHITGTLEPAGPVNVFNEKVAVAEAVNRAIETKTAYDTTHPPTTPVILPPPEPTGPLIGTGSPVVADPSKYMIDLAVVRRRR